MKNIHLIMPFARWHLWDTLVNAYRPMNIILHPLFYRNEKRIFSTEEWIQPFVADMDAPAEYSTAIINAFIDNAGIVDGDYYVTASDDDMYERQAFDKIRRMDDPVVIISMKRGYQTPLAAPEDKAYDPTTLYADTESMKVGRIGGEQIFMKGSVLKTIYFNEWLPVVADGFVAETLKLMLGDSIRYEPNLYALFNYYEPGRWERAGLKISFGAIVNDQVRLDMCLKQSQIPGQMNVVFGAESATKGLNKLLDIIEREGADVAALVHQDMYFRQGWLVQVRDQIAKLPDSWVVAGIIGKDMKGLICGKLHDTRIPLHFNTADIHTFPHEACCFDECVILVNMKTGFRFDETLDGWDLYGTLCVLQAWEMGGTAWIIDAFAEHHCMRPFTWVPDELFKKNFKWLWTKYSGIVDRIDTTAMGMPEDMRKELRFGTSASPDVRAVNRLSMQ